MLNQTMLHTDSTLAFFQSKEYAVQGFVNSIGSIDQAQFGSNIGLQKFTPAHFFETKH